MEDFNAGQGRGAGEEAILGSGITPAVSASRGGWVGGGRGQPVA